MPSYRVPSKDCHGVWGIPAGGRHHVKWNHIIYAAAAATNRRSGVVVMVVMVMVMVMSGVVVVSMVMTALLPRLVLVELLP